MKRNKFFWNIKMFNLCLIYLNPFLFQQYNQDHQSDNCLMFPAFPHQSHPWQTNIITKWNVTIIPEVSVVFGNSFCWQDRGGLVVTIITVTTQISFSHDCAIIPKIENKDVNQQNHLSQGYICIRQKRVASNRILLFTLVTIKEVISTVRINLKQSIKIKREIYKT